MTTDDAPSTDFSPADPSYNSVKNYLLYTLSLPERTLRSGAGLVSGALRESTSLLVPQAFQSSTTYRVMVRQMLDFVAEDVGRVRRKEAVHAAPQVQDFVARKTVGNFLDLAGMATLHVSPLLVLAIVSDMAYGSQAYLKELNGELKQRGVIEGDSTIDHVDDLLAAVARASQTASMAFNTPPLSVEGLKETIDQTRLAISAIDPRKVLPQAEAERLWQEFHEVAKQEGVGILDISSAVTLRALEQAGSLGRGALSTVTVAGRLFDRHVLEHYTTALAEIREQGLYATLAKTSEPYIEAVWLNFSSEKGTITQDLCTGKLVGQAWSAVRRWFGSGKQAPAPGALEHVTPAQKINLR